MSRTAFPFSHPRVNLIFPNFPTTVPLVSPDSLVPFAIAPCPLTHTTRISVTFAKFGFASNVRTILVDATTDVQVVSALSMLA